MNIHDILFMMNLVCLADTSVERPVAGDLPVSNQGFWLSDFCCYGVQKAKRPDIPIPFGLFTSLARECDMAICNCVFHINGCGDDLQEVLQFRLIKSA